MDVSVIIVNYNTKEITAACIDSIFKFTDSVTFEIILVDNASNDGSRDLFSSDCRITYIYNNEQGSVSGATTTPTGKAMDSITFTAIPNYGYHFVQWADKSIENPRTIYLTQDTIMEAFFDSDKKANDIQFQFADQQLLPFKTFYQNNSSSK